jgi:hypothetical protein
MALKSFSSDLAVSPSCEPMSCLPSPLSLPLPSFSSSSFLSSFSREFA